MATTRRLRAFNRWMKSAGVRHIDALRLIDDGGGAAVIAAADLKEGDTVASIPKRACLTLKTSRGWHVIEEAGLGGFLGLAVGLMYERSIGPESEWAGYLQMLPAQECLPLVWTVDDVDTLLLGTELHKIVKEDKALVYQDWEECILPLMVSEALELDPKFFGVEQYFAAKSLIASRSFQIDDYHGYGMVPLADLFNHKTGAEDVHFTAASPNSDSEDDVSDDMDDSIDEKEPLTEGSHMKKSKSANESILDGTSYMDENPTVLEMIMVKDVKSGTEVFNTYGSLGNAALLHRYGFTEPNNPYDIVNIDLELVLQWSSSLFSNRYSRSRLSLWRRLNYSGCISQDSEYFEISYEGEPQIELLILLYIMVLPEEDFRKLDISVSTSEMTRDFLIKSVRDALLRLADVRESFYGSSSLEDDIDAMKKWCCIKERKLYHSMALRVSERTILGKLRKYARRSKKFKREHGVL